MIFVWASLFNIWTFFFNFNMKLTAFFPTISKLPTLFWFSCLNFVWVRFSSVAHFLIWTGKNVEMHRPLWFGFILNGFLVLSIWCYWLMKFEKWWNWSFHCILRQSWWTKTDNVHRCTACDHFIYIAKLSCTHADRWVQEVTLIKMGEKKTGW